MKKEVDSHIIEYLLPGPSHVPTLVETISTKHKVSIQSVYKSLRLLAKKEKIIIHNKMASLSLVWINKEKEKLIFSEYAYTSGKEILKNISKVKVKVKFYFKTITELDLFWTHVYTILAQNSKQDAPRYMLTPHDFFLYAREETDTFWVNTHITDTVVTRLIITHGQELDRLTVKKRKTLKHHPFEILLGYNPLKQNSNIYYNLLDQYIIKGTFDTQINKHLETFISYHKTLHLSLDAKKEIATILSMKGRFTLSIEKNKQKAETIRNKLKKFFE